jgi:hypothetical protein
MQSLANAAIGILVVTSTLVAVRLLALHPGRAPRRSCCSAGCCCSRSASAIR